MRCSMEHRKKEEFAKTFSGDDGKVFTTHMVASMGTCGFFHADINSLSNCNVEMMFFARLFFLHNIVGELINTFSSVFSGAVES